MSCGAGCLQCIHTPKAGGNFERASLPSPCLEIPLRDGKIYKLNRLQEVSLRPREVLTSWKRGWIAQGFQPERPGSGSFSSQAGSHWPFPGLLYTVTEADSTTSTPEAGLWGWEILGILSQWEGFTSLSLEQRVKDLCSS